MKADKLKRFRSYLDACFFSGKRQWRYPLSGMFFEKLTVGAICLKQRGVTTGPYSRLDRFCPKTIIIGVLTVRFRSDMINYGFSLRERDFKLIPNMSGYCPSGRSRQYKLKSLILAQNERWRHG